MKNYNNTEIGMLLGAGIGGAVSIICFNLWSNVLFFAIAAIGIALGVAIGNAMDKRNSANSVNNKIRDIK